MNQFTVLARKELVQMVREMKVVWLPIVFILLGITQPIMNYYLPSILEMLGGGQGISIDLSLVTQTGGEVLASTLGSQFDQLGVIIIIVSMMGIVQSDKANGMLAFILTRPVRVSSYIGGKIFSHYLFIACSVTFGYIASYLYTYILFTEVPLTDLIVAFLFYLLWVLFIVSFTTMMSTIFNSQGIIALISIVFLLGCRVIVGLNPILDHINPASMSTYAMEILISGTWSVNVIWNIMITLILSALAINVSNIWITGKKYRVN
ncbi:MAG TPA: ABC transporter permease subunit [Candidatus Avamphibacillus sp.]|nr:ABC transporter permease subunit [Candidatus Avamphibacillus sp.]